MARYKPRFYNRKTDRAYIRDPKKWSLAYWGLEDSKGVQRRAYPEIKLTSRKAHKINKLLSESKTLKVFDEKIADLLEDAIPYAYRIYPTNPKTGEVYERLPREGTVVRYALWNVRTESGTMLYWPTPKVTYIEDPLHEGKYLKRYIELPVEQKFNNLFYNQINKLAKKAVGNTAIFYVDMKGRIRGPNEKVKILPFLVNSNGQFKRWLAFTFLKLDKVERIALNKYLIPLELNKYCGEFTITGDTISDGVRNLILDIGETKLKNILKKRSLLQADFMGEFRSGGDNIKIIGSVNLGRNLFEMNKRISGAIVNRLASVGHRFTKLSVLKKFDNVSIGKKYQILSTKWWVDPKTGKRHDPKKAGPIIKKRLKLFNEVTDNTKAYFNEKELRLNTVQRNRLVQVTAGKAKPRLRIKVKIKEIKRK